MDNNEHEEFNAKVGTQWVENLYFEFTSAA